MIVVCSKCASRVDIGAAKAPGSGIRCPKCNTILNPENPSPASDKGALTVGQSPATDKHRFEEPGPAPLFELEPGGTEERGGMSPVEEMGRLLANLLNQNGKINGDSPNIRPSYNPRKALVCTAEPHRAQIARQLAQNGYQVFVAQDTGQAVDRMRQNQLEIVLLDPEFDSAEQGAAFVIREVNILRPAQRRRLFFVMLSPVLRTMEAHAAFLHNVNAIVNLREIDNVASILDHALREYNELYKELNLALNVPAL